jgi:hypothetical protein
MPSCGLLAFRAIWKPKRRSKALRFGCSVGVSYSCFSFALARCSFFAAALTAVRVVAASSLPRGLSPLRIIATHVHVDLNRHNAVADYAEGRPVMIVFTTVISGILVFVGSQFALKFALEPIVETNKTLARISHILLYNQAKITNSGADEELSRQIKELSASLRVDHSRIPCRPCRNRWLRDRAVIEASRELNSLSAHDTRPEDRWEAIEKVGRLLRIVTTY